jgi:ankyrin repeat protein
MFRKLLHKTSELDPPSILLQILENQPRTAHYVETGTFLTPLMLAITNNKRAHEKHGENYEEVIQKLLDNGVYPDAVNSLDQSAIILAIYSMNYSMNPFAMLISAGADVHTVYEDRCLHMTILIECSNPEFVIQSIEMLIGKGADLNRVSQDGFNPFFEAALDDECSMEVLHFLLSKGCDFFTETDTFDFFCDEGSEAYTCVNRWPLIMCVIVTQEIGMYNLIDLGVWNLLFDLTSQE